MQMVTSTSKDTKTMPICDKQRCKAKLVKIEKSHKDERT